jgi:hypothetical protein
MVSRLLSAALAAAVTLSALGQSAEMIVPISTPDPVSASEFGHGYGGEVRAITKSAGAGFSGSLGLSLGSGSTNRRGYEASAGGTLVDDKAWFFASAQSVTSRFGALPNATANGAGNLVDAKVIANLGDRNVLNASYAAGQNTFTTPATVSLPSSFLSLHYTGVVSSNMFFTANVTRSKTTEPAWATDVVQPR